MALPYPYEVESGELKPQAPEPGTPIDVSARVEHLVRPTPVGLSVAARELRTPTLAHRDDMVNRYRAVLIDRMRERWPEATEATWRRLETVLAHELREGQPADESLVHVLLLTVDGL